MMKGIYTAASGMMHQMRALNETAANLANVSTPGYKRSEVVGESFGDLVTQFQAPTPFDRVGAGVRTAEATRHESQGPLQRTSNPLHVALSGEGYFQVQDAEGRVKVTRNGDFGLDAQGYLATLTGERVLGIDNQPIGIGQIASTTLHIAQDGTLRDADRAFARLKVVEAPPTTGPGFPASSLDAPAVAGGYNVMQGYLEGSNVNVVSELVALMDINKAFNFDQKAITVQDNLLNKTVNDLGRVQ